MSWSVKILPPVSQAFRSYGFDRQFSLRFWNALYATLPMAARSDRVSSDDRLFIHRITLKDSHGEAVDFYLTVDDATATEVLLVVAIKVVRKSEM
jgi:hypothetical protein